MIHSVTIRTNTISRYGVVCDVEYMGQRKKTYTPDSVPVSVADFFASGNYKREVISEVAVCYRRKHL